MPVAVSAEQSSWTFLTNHSHVLICIARDPTARTRDLAGLVGITERAVQRIVADLVGAGYLSCTREGRRKRYEIARQQHLRHPIEAHRHVGDLLALAQDEATGTFPQA